MPKQRRRRELQQRLFSATFGALLTTITVTPLDVVKVRLQAAQLEHKSTLESLFKIFRTEGLLSLYRGFVPSMLMSLPGTIVYFVGYERIREGLEGRIDGNFAPLMAGSVARIMAATVVSPLELLRTRMQFAGRERGKLGLIAREIFEAVKLGGLSHLWQGLQATLWRDVPFSALYWMILEQMRARFLPSKPANENSLERSAVSFGCGAVAGAVAATLTTPFDVAKTRQQVLLNRIIDAHKPTLRISTLKQLQLIAREEGLAGLMRGVVPRVGKVSPACAIMIGSYEYGKHLFDDGLKIL